MTTTPHAGRGARPPSRGALRLSHLPQLLAAWPAYFLLKHLPLDLAERLAGWIGRGIGPRIGASRRAVRNLRLVFPAMPDAETRRIVRAMWENLARVPVDYIHLGRIFADPPRIEINGAEVLVRLKESGRGAILVSGHVGNWEMVTLAARRFGLRVVSVYRRFNNPVVDAYIHRLQAASGVEAVQKGAPGARRMMAALAEGATVVILADQRMNNGITVPFFGIPAMTAPALARLAFRFDVPVVPVRAERLALARFKVTVEEPLDVPRTGDAARDEAAMMAAVNARIEAWIRAKPEQWLWLHRRWPRDAKPASGQ